MLVTLDGGLFKHNYFNISVGFTCHCSFVLAYVDMQCYFSSDSFAVWKPSKCYSPERCKFYIEWIRFSHFLVTHFS